MGNIMANLIKQNIEELKELDKQRIAWLRISGFVALVIVLIIVDWQYVKDTKWGWLVVVGGITISAVWWYWTMIVIRKLLNQKTIETETLIEIINDVKEIKEDVKNFNKPLDKRK